MAARNKDSPFEEDKLTTKKVSPQVAYFDDIGPILSGNDDNGASDDDEMINLSGAGYSEEQLILESASQGKNKQTAVVVAVATADNVTVTGSASAGIDSFSLGQKTSHSSNRRSLSKENDQEHLYEDANHSHRHPDPYTHPNLYPVSSKSPSFNSGIANGLTKSPSPTSTTTTHPQEQQGRFDPLSFSDPTFINSFSPQLTPSSPSSSSPSVAHPPTQPTLPLLGAHQHQHPSKGDHSLAHQQQPPSLLLLTPGEPQDSELFSVPGVTASNSNQANQERSIYDQFPDNNQSTNAPDLIPVSDSGRIINRDGHSHNNSSLHPQRRSHTPSSTTANLLDISYEEEDLRQHLYPNNPESSPSITMNNNDGFDHSHLPLQGQDLNDDAIPHGTGSSNLLNTPRPMALTPGSPTATPFTDTQPPSSDVDGFVNELTTDRDGNIINPINSKNNVVSSSQGKPPSPYSIHTNDFYSSTSSATNTFSSGCSSPTSHAPLFPNNSTTSGGGGFNISSILSVDRKSQSARSKSVPATSLTHEQYRNQNATTGAGAAAVATARGGGKGGNQRAHAQQHQHAVDGPLRREMISPTMFGQQFIDEYGDVQHQQNNSTDASLFPSTAVTHGDDGVVVGDGSSDRCSMTSSTAAMYRDHCHSRRGARTVDRVARRQLVAVVVLCLLFMTGEAIGGALSNSLALFTDVLHLGSDLISFIISLLALYLSTKPASKTMSFGYHRAEVLGALFSVFLIWLVSGVLCYIAVERILQEHYKDVKPDEMLITASLGVVFNIVMGFVLHSEMCCKGAHSHSSFGHGHSHGGGGGHSHSSGNTANGGTNSSVEYQPLENSRTPSSRRRRQLSEDVEYGMEENTEETRKILDSTSSLAGPDDDLYAEEDHEGHSHGGTTKHKNLNVRAAFIHVLGDIIQSLGVLIAACIIKFQPDERYRLADPICTFIFSIIVLVTTISVLRDTLRVMMEGVPRDLSFEGIKRELLSIQGVVMVHSLHIWALTLDRNAISVHIAIDDPSLHQKVLTIATSLVQRKHQFYSSTIQVEMYNREVMSSCHQCQELE